MELIKYTHKELVEIAFRWCLKNASCGVAFKELDCANQSGEIPDVIGFGGWKHSVLIECKVSRSDFLADKNKPFRKDPKIGMGSRRYYCCPKGLIKKEELPEGWGLIYVDEKRKALCVHKPLIKKVNDYGNEYNAWYEHEKDLVAENALMYSALRRLFIKGYVKHIYDKQYVRGADVNELISLNDIQNGFAGRSVGKNF